MLIGTKPPNVDPNNILKMYRITLVYLTALFSTTGGSKVCNKSSNKAVQTLHTNQEKNKLKEHLATKQLASNKHQNECST